MHQIEEHIIRVLATMPQPRYRDLRPPKVESNLFIYHLKQLISQGLIEKHERAYRLTAAGQRYMEKLSVTEGAIREQPTVETVIICRNEEGKYLLCVRKHQPFLGLLGFPFGKIHRGESIHEAAERELREKTGLSGSLTHRGVIHLRIRGEKGVFNIEMFCHVFTGENLAGNLKSDTCRFDELPKIQEVGQLVPGFLLMVESVRKPMTPFFFREIVV